MLLVVGNIVKWLGITKNLLNEVAFASSGMTFAQIPLREQIVSVTKAMKTQAGALSKPFLRFCQK